MVEASFDNDMKIRTVERIVLVIGLGLLAFWASARLYRSYASKAAIARFEAEEARSPTASDQVLLDPDSGSKVDERLWSTQRIKAYRESLGEKTDIPLALLRIPKIGLEVPVFNGTDDLTLNRGVGRILGTAQIGQPGNLGVAGHRDGFFRGLENITMGDVIEVVRLGHTDKYTVTEIRIVKPEDVYVLAPTRIPTLTLVTCYPFYYVGHAPKRYIVTASLENARQSDLHPDQDPISTGSNAKNKEKNK